jgi:hypothetical protein
MRDYVAVVFKDPAKLTKLCTHSGSSIMTGKSPYTELG